MLETPHAASIEKVNPVWHEGVGNIYVQRDWKESEELSSETKKRLNDKLSNRLGTRLASHLISETLPTEELVAKCVAKYKTSRVVEYALGLVFSGKDFNVNFGTNMLEILLQVWWQEGKALDYVFEEVGLCSHSLDFKRLTVLERCIKLWNKEEHSDFELVEVLIRYYGDSWLSSLLSDAILYGNAYERKIATNLETKMMQDWKKRSLSAENVYNMLKLGSVREHDYSEADTKTYEGYSARCIAEEVEKVLDAMKTENGVNKMKRLKEEMQVEKRNSINERKSKHPRIE